jgi:hypothetical protein
MLIVDEIVRLKEIVAARFVSTNPIDKINYQHTLAYGGARVQQSAWRGLDRSNPEH